MKSKFIALAAAGLSLAFTPSLRADVEAVNKYLGEATELVDKGSMFFEDARGKIELAESSMDDVPEAQKAPLQAKIDALKAKVDGAANAQAKASLEEKLKRAMSDAEESIGNLATWKGSAEAVNEILNDPKTTTLLGADAVAAAKKQFGTYEKLNGTKALKANLAQAGPAVDQLEKDWTERKTTLANKDATPNDRSSAIEDTQRDLEGIERVFADLPSDNSDVKALRARVDKIKTESAAAGSAAGASEQLDEINRFLESYENEFKGMESEGGAPSMADYRGNKPAAQSLGAPKTAAYVSRVGDFLKELPDRENYKATKDAPAVKAKVAELQAKVDAGYAKLKKNGEDMVKAVEAQKATQDSAENAIILSSTIRNVLGEESPDAKTLMARLDKYQTDFKNAGAAADAAKDEYYKKMTEQAGKAWPDMAAKYEIVSPFDPNQAAALKGKYIRITGNNLMGSKFKPTDFPYATTLNGIAVAGQYDPAIKAALAEVEGKLGRAIGDSDDDGKWIAICRVEGTTGKLVELVNHEGDVKVDGQSVGTVTGTEEKTVDAPIVTVVALKAGPVAAAAGQGAVKEDGTIGKSNPPAGSMVGVAGSSSGGGHGFSFVGMFMGVFGIAVGAASLMKAKFAPLATNAGAMQLTEKVGGQNIQYLGLAGIALGALGVLWNIVALLSAPLHALLGIVGSAAMIVAGGVAAREIFDSRKVLPPNVGQMLTQFAVPAGLACAALGLLTMIAAI